MDGLNVLITGSTTGLGLHTAKALYRKGANIIITCRDEVKGRKAVEEIASQNTAEQKEQQNENQRLHLYTLDITNYNSIVAFCDEIYKDFNKLHVIINNAGIMGWPFELSVDGIEMHFATNVFGHFAVCERLLPLLMHSDREDFKSRIIVIGSGLYKNAHSMPAIQKLLGEEGWDYNAKQAYAISKLGNCLYTVAMAKMLEQYDIDIYCVRPGFVNGTELGRETHWLLRALAYPLIWLIAKNLDQGIETIVYLSETSAEQLKNGGLYYDKKEENYNQMVNTTSIRQLWATLMHIEDAIFKRNPNLTESQKGTVYTIRDKLNESLIGFDENCHGDQ
ncbi:unnamed protein product [Caenorhabditis angaria]|uniref:Uncharacterized protein n=1 Tax=Caenorhabditis angaria TaxID=860376 RepID=A0A9P1I4L5_9PELO|nr:unnamed protein product [Caenorhabditis angaria]